jgi:Caspase domain
MLRLFAPAIVLAGAIELCRSPSLSDISTAIWYWNMIPRYFFVHWEQAMRARIVLTALAFLLLAAPAAHAERRVALVIGNSNYPQGAALANPVNDANAVGLMLTSAGFEVDVRSNLAEKEMRRALVNFSLRTRDADIAVVYYAGHGIEVNGDNYLIPIDAALGRDIDVEDETVSLKRVMELIEPARRLRLVILDACRDNPFAGTMKRTSLSRGPISRGLARVEIANPDTLIAFAAKAGSTAIDSIGSHSPFTDALLTHLPTPGLDLRIAFGRVRDEVRTATDWKQDPFLYGSLGGDMVALVPGEGQPAAYTPAKPGSEAWREYEYAKKAGTKEVWEAFLASHPSGVYATIAKTELDKLLSAPPATAVTGSQSAPPAVAGAPAVAAVEPTVPAEAVKPPAAPEAKPAKPAATTTPSPPPASTRKFNAVSRHEPEPTTRRATRDRDEDERPKARARQATRESTRGEARERPHHTGGGGTACAYGRAGVRWGRAYGLDNGSGIIAAVASRCGG